jgi:hypothetical protein
MTPVPGGLEREERKLPHQDPEVRVFGRRGIAVGVAVVDGIRLLAGLLQRTVVTNRWPAMDRK